MHTITVSIQGDVSVAESIEASDAEALPLFIRLKAILRSEEAPKPAGRRGRPRKEKPAVDVERHDFCPEESEAAANPTEG